MIPHLPGSARGSQCLHTNWHPISDCQDGATGLSDRPAPLHRPFREDAYFLNSSICRSCQTIFTLADFSNDVRVEVRDSRLPLAWAGRSAIELSPIPTSMSYQRRMPSTTSRTVPATKNRF